MAEGKEKGLAGISGCVARVSICGFRFRPLDPDNFAGSCKDIIDGLVQAGLIAGDAAWQITLETNQIKVASLKDERTEIEITPAC